jgi:hypothetical protein
MSSPYTHCSGNPSSYKFFFRVSIGKHTRLLLLMYVSTIQIVQRMIFQENNLFSKMKW